uniref:Putative LOC100197594 [Hydra vulgaris] n=1 Tax=Lepeophtheirus salmonis TaxID=72036 RepID=A0A0K2UQ70_LEPSM
MVNLLPCVHANFPYGNTAKINQTFLGNNIHFWDKRMWPPYSPIVNPFDFSFWRGGSVASVTRTFKAIKAHIEEKLAAWTRISFAILVTIFVRGLSPSVRSMVDK